MGDDDDNDERKLPSTASSNLGSIKDTKRKKLVVVVKKNIVKKNKLASAIHKDSRSLPRAGLPSCFSSNQKQEKEEEKQTDATDAVKKNDDERQSSSTNDDNDNNDLFVDNNDMALPCETLMVIQSLLRQPNNRLEVICESGSRNNHNTNPFSIYGVLPSKLHSLLNPLQNHNQDFVTREIQQCLSNGDLIQLSSGGGGGGGGVHNNKLSVLFLKQDYIRAVKKAASRPHSHSQATAAAGTTNNIINNDNRIVEWFIEAFLLKKKKKSSSCHNNYGVVSEQLLQERNDLPCPVSNLVSELMRLEVILPLRRHGQASTTTMYQFWLPGFALLAKAWYEACQKLVLKLKRAHYKELSISALQQPYSPIPTSLVIESLEDQGGTIEQIERPSGTHVKLL